MRLGAARLQTTARTRLQPLDRALASLPTGDSSGVEEDSLHAVEAITEFWLRGVRLTRTSCMPRALARYALLRRAGVPAQIVFGVRLDESHDLAGHAWIELRGQAVMEREPLDYRETFRYG